MYRTIIVIKPTGNTRHSDDDSVEIDLEIIALFGLLSSVSLYDSLVRMFGKAIIVPIKPQKTVMSEILPIPMDCSTPRHIIVEIMPMRMIRYSIDTIGDFLISSSIEDTTMDMNKSDHVSRPRNPCSRS